MIQPQAIWTNLSAEAGRALSAAQLAQMDAYLSALIEKNQHMNLTRIVDHADAQIKHVADALTLLRLIPESSKTLADVGTGGGIPGVILAIARPDVTVTLIDSTRKKLDAVQTICGEIGLNNVHTLHGRVESVQLKFDVVTARAVAELGTLLGWCRGLLKPESVLLAMKGPKAQAEIDALSASQRRGWNLSVHAVAIEALAGHTIVEARLRR